MPTLHHGADARQHDGTTDDELSVADLAAALVRALERAEARAREEADAIVTHPDDTAADGYRAGELVGRAQGLALAVLLAGRALEAIERERGAAS